MTTYTNITKPTGTSYTNLNSIGKQQYDESDILYDDPNVFYDGINFMAYTNISKPTGGFTLEQGMATGLIMPPTYAQSITYNDPYIYISKPS